MRTEPERESFSPILKKLGVRERGKETEKRKEGKRVDGIA